MRRGIGVVTAIGAALALGAPVAGATPTWLAASPLSQSAAEFAVAARAQCTPVTVAAGGASFSAAAGDSTAVGVVLTTPVRQLLERHHHLTRTVALESHGASGQSATTSGRVMVKEYVKPKKAKGKKKK